MKRIRLVHLLLWFAIFLAMATGVWMLQSWQGRAQTRNPERLPAAVPAVSVAVAAARSGSMPAYLDGLGTVTPYFPVTVKTRVDGQLMNIHFGEGHWTPSGARERTRATPFMKPACCVSAPLR